MNLPLVRPNMLKIRATEQKANIDYIVRVEIYNEIEIMLLPFYICLTRL
jgi:hypothetical protein